MKNAYEKFGQLKDVCITNKGITIVCEKGVLFRNIPTKVAERLRLCKERPDHFRFSDSGTFLITYDKGDNS